MSEDLAKPELSTTSKRKYGPYRVERFNDLLQASIGAQDLGKVQIDCKFLMNQSQWGTLDLQKAGIIYLDLTIIQPGDCRLSSAVIQVTLDDEDPYLAQEFPRDTKVWPLQIRERGPREILGGPRHETVITHNRFGPEVEIGSIAGIGGVVHESMKKTVRDCWWRFESHLKPDKKAKSRAYKVLQWHVTENELQAQPLHKNTFHTAFSFAHGGQPFFMHVKIDGKLQDKTSNFRHRLGRKLKFASLSHESRQTTTLVHFRKPEMFNTPLDDLEKCLDDEMQRINMAHPPVVPDVQGKGASEPQSPGPIQHHSPPFIDIDDYRTSDESSSVMPTIDEMMSHSLKILDSPVALDTSNLGLHDGTQAKGLVEVEVGPVVARQRTDIEKVDAGGFMYYMKNWMLHIATRFWGYHGGEKGVNQ
ncbi:hypothetical protein F4808DRAFT_472227 [Astrocystis sublimbata]|nr:hypothetical protein F4808DRAFT_472227 [Astrocystis sublimbata]